MRTIVFDTGPIISLTVTNLLGLLTSLKDKYRGEFLITESIRRELIERPLETRKFKFEALQVLRCIGADVLSVYQSAELRSLTIKLLELSNKSFYAKGNPIQIAHYAEMSGLAAAIITNADAFVVDERNTRLILEDPGRLGEILCHKLHTEVKSNKQNIESLRRMTKAVKLIRSIELVSVSYELGLLDKYLVNIPNARKNLLDAVLWAVKLNGCSITEKEIEEIIKIETRS